MNKKTIPVCTYCGRVWEPQIGSYDDIPPDLEKQIREHVASCDKNPLRQQIEDLKTLCRQLVETCQKAIKPLQAVNTIYPGRFEVQVLWDIDSALAAAKKLGIEP